jgi:4'-phosphopantetheinyl transferase
MPALEQGGDSTEKVAHQTSLAWESSPSCIRIGAGDIHLWRAWADSLSASPDPLKRFLSKEEMERANRFRLNRDRDRFILRRGLLRKLLGEYLERDPIQLNLCYGSHGKPYLPEGAEQSPLRFNLTHSSGLTVLAFTWQRELGGDSERIDSRVAQEQIPEQFFSPAEVVALRSMPLQWQSQAFFLAWTRKEAFIKATGEGLSRGLEKFTVSLRPDKPARLLWVEGQEEERQRWSMMSFIPGPGFAGALVVEGPVRSIHAYSWGE